MHFFPSDFNMQKHRRYAFRSSNHQNSLPRTPFLYDTLVYFKPVTISRWTCKDQRRQRISEDVGEQVRFHDNVLDSWHRKNNVTDDI